MKNVALTLLSFFFVSCSFFNKPIYEKDPVYLNPYEGIDFSSITRVNAISHEHIFSKDRLKIAYDRGIRWFAAVNYQPAVPSYPFSKWSGNFLDYINDEENDLTVADSNTGAVGSIRSFMTSDGRIVMTDSLPQVPNAEHPTFAWNKQEPSMGKMPHFNVMGSLFGEAGHGQGNTRMMKIWDHPLWDLNDINEKFIANALYEDKVFGTINHSTKVPDIIRILDECPAVFKGMEIFNQYFTPSTLQEFKDAYDTILKQGYKIWCLAVVDWQGAIGEENPEEEKECTFDRGCNVLLIDKYDDMSVEEKSEAGLDAYISGRYYASGLGKHTITELTTKHRTVKISVDGTPSTIKAITSERVLITTDNETCVDILPEETYIRFEVYYYDKEKTDMDFIFTNPIFISYNN